MTVPVKSDAAMCESQQARRGWRSSWEASLSCAVLMGPRRATPHLLVQGIVSRLKHAVRSKYFYKS